MSEKLRCILLLAVLILWGCVPQQPLASGQTVVGPTLQSTVVVTATTSDWPGSTSPAVWPTSVSPTTVPPSPIPGCPVAGNPPPPSAPADESQLATVLGEYLDAGASLEALEQVLFGWLGSKTPAALESRQPGGHLVWQVDLTGDGVSETVAIPDFPLYSPRHGDLLIWQCRGGRMQLLFSAKASNGGDWAFYQVQRVGDTNHDGQPELFFDSVNVTMMYPTVRLYVIEWDGTAFLQRAPGFPELVGDVTFDFTDEGIAVDPGWYGLSGAGMPRDYYQRWAWQGRVLTMTEEVYGPPTARIHYLYDGDDALMGGNAVAATVSYQEAISRTDLPTGIVTESRSDSERVLLAFARFKLMTAYAVSQDDANLAAIYQELQAGVSEESEAHVYVAMAKAFWEAYQAGRGNREACVAAITVATANDSAVQLLYAGYAKFAGYVSTRYEKPEDLCRVP